jgi:hypothetical protein
MLMNNVTLIHSFLVVRWWRFMNYCAARKSIERSPVHRLTPFIKARR